MSLNVTEYICHEVSHNYINLNILTWWHSITKKALGGHFPWKFPMRFPFPYKFNGNLPLTYSCMKALFKQWKFAICIFFCTKRYRLKFTAYILPLSCAGLYVPTWYIQKSIFCIKYIYVRSFKELATIWNIYRYSVIFQHEVTTPGWPGSCQHGAATSCLGKPGPKTRPLFLKPVLGKKVKIALFHYLNCAFFGIKSQKLLPHNNKHILKHNSSDECYLICS